MSMLARRRPQAVRVIAVQDEEPFMRELIKELGIFGFDVPPPYHTYDARRSSPGFPDIVAVRPPRVLFIECKRDDAPLSLPPEQQAWSDALERCPGVEYYTWRPRDWPFILQTLSRRRMT